MLSTELRTFIIDEADEMLRMGFIEDVETILAKLPDKKTNSFVFSNYASRIRQIANSYLNNPVSVEIRTETATVKSIEQRFLICFTVKNLMLYFVFWLLKIYLRCYCIVCTKSSTEEVAESRQQQGYRAMAIHGDITKRCENALLLSLNKELLIF